MSVLARVHVVSMAVMVFKESYIVFKKYTYTRNETT